MNVLLDVFNLFDRQGSTILDQRYNLQKDGNCGGIPASLCNGDGGLLALPNSVTPKGALSNPTATATNPDFLKSSVGTQFTLTTAPMTPKRVGKPFSFLPSNFATVAPPGELTAVAPLGATAT